MRRLSFQLLLVSLISVFGFTSCSTVNVGDAVCNYGGTFCEVTTSLCNDVPGVPPQLCEYLNLACYNLNVICDLREQKESLKFQEAVSNLEEVTKKIQEWNYARQERLKESKKN